MFKRKRNAAAPPGGYHDGTLASVSIRRRQQQKRFGMSGPNYIPSGWDLVDIHSGQVIAEYNDETAPPPLTRFRNSSHSTKLGYISGVGTDPLNPDGNELAELFQSVYLLCYNTTIEALKLLGQAITEHEDSPDGTMIAELRISAYTSLPKSAGMTKTEAFKAGYTGEEPF